MKSRQIHARVRLSTQGQGLGQVRVCVIAAENEPQKCACPIAVKNSHGYV